MSDVRNRRTAQQDLPFGVVVRKTAIAHPEPFRFAEAVDALVMAVDYMRRGYWVRLTDPTLRAIDEDGALSGDLSLMMAQSYAQHQGQFGARR